ncbi:MAG: hypothetical protein ACRDQ1_03635 [Sciscionella sp.]
MSSAARHRPWCAPQCPYPPTAAEGIHLGSAWTLVPEDTGQVEIRLVERVGEDTDGQAGVLVSITERQLRNSHGLVDITTSTGLTADEALRLAEQLMAFATHAARPG